MRCPETISKAVADPSGVVVRQGRTLGVVVMGVVEPQVEPACRGIAQREVVQRPVAQLLRERLDVVSRRTGQTVGIGRKRGGVGSAHPPPLFRGVLDGGPELMAPPLVGHPFILPDVVQFSFEGVQRAQVETRQLLAPGRRIGNIRRPSGRRKDEVAAGVVGVIIAVRVVGMDLAREGCFVAAAQHDVDRRSADVVLRRGTEHHLGLLDPLNGGRTQQRGQLLGGHRRGAPVQDHRDGRRPGQRQRALLLRDARQAGQSLISIVHGLPLDQPPEVVGQPPLLDLHDGTFALDHHGIDGRIRLRQADIAQIGKVRLDAIQLIDQMLDLQPVGTHRRADLEASVGPRDDGIQIDRIAVEQHDGSPGDGGIRRIDQTSADHAIGGGGRLGLCNECQERCCRDKQPIKDLGFHRFAVFEGGSSCCKITSERTFPGAGSDLAGPIPTA